MLQPKPDELQILNKDTRGLHFLADEGNKKHPGKIEMLLQNVNVNQKYHWTDSISFEGKIVSGYVYNLVP